MNSAVSGDAAEQPRGKQRWRWAMLAIVFIIVALAGIDLTLAGDALLVTVEGTDSVPARAILSPSQQSLLAELGNPDGFTIYFVEDEGVPVRVETWSYYTARRELSFVNGELTGEEVPEPASVTQPAPFTPDQFTPFAELEQVVAAAGIVEHLDVHLEDELLAGGTVHVAEQLMFGLRDGRLLYVEAFPLSEGG